MNLNDEILARIRAATTWDKAAKFSDFRVMVADNGYILVNLRTGRAQLMYDELSQLHDLERLFPDSH